MAPSPAASGFSAEAGDIRPRELEAFGGVSQSRSSLAFPSFVKAFAAQPTLKA